MENVNHTSHRTSHAHALLYALTLSLMLTGAQALAIETGLQCDARTVQVPMLPAGYQASADAAEDYLLFVKFADSDQVRTKLGTTYSQSGSDIDDALAIASAADASFEQVLTGNTCPGLSTLQSTAEQRSGRPARDLAGIHRVMFSAAKTAQEIADLGNDLTALTEADYAQMVFRYVDPPQSNPPDFSGLQNYLGQNPGGNFDYASSLNLTGNGIRITEISVTYDEDHIDLASADLGMEPPFQAIGFPELPNFPALPEIWLDHGTATLGMLFSDWNSFGTDGMVPGAEGYLYPLYNTNFQNLSYRFEEAYCNALVDSAADDLGNIVYIEAQFSNQSHDNLPMEIQPNIWELTRLGVDAGVVVLAATGNGDNDLDSPAFQDWRDCGDSGALLVGAGSADTNHDRLAFSNYGQRVRPQGWGEGIVTLGCGDLWGGDPGGGWPGCMIEGYESTVHERYTGHFSGTSGATPMVTAAAALVQEYTISQGLAPLDSVDMRSLLTHTGIPQGTALSGNIGPFINVASAINSHNESDIEVTTSSSGLIITTSLTNTGPRVTSGAILEVIYSALAGQPYALSPINVPDNCVYFDPTPDSQNCLGGNCAVGYECTGIGDLEVGESFDMVWQSDTFGLPHGINVTATGGLNGELADPNLSNNSDSGVYGGGGSPQ